MRGRVAFLLKGYPRLSETFIAQEILALEQRGLAILIVSLRHPTDRSVHDIHRQIGAGVLYLPEYLYQEPLRVLKGCVAASRRAGFGTSLRVWLRDLWRDPTSNRVRRFGQALVLARELPEDVRLLHAHFMHTPGSVARYAALLLALPWTCSAHAKDIWTTPEWEKREKLNGCRWTVTCTAYNAAHLAGLAPDPERVELVYHGLDFTRFPSTAKTCSDRDGSDGGAPVRILSVGRAVEKKGYEDLIDALALLPRDLHWEFHHVGGGQLLERLEQNAAAAGLEDRIFWHGAMAQEAVIEHYSNADLFVLPCRIARDGDRDGLPNVLMEAQCVGLVCLSTQVSAVPELIEDGVTGLLVPEREVADLSRSLERLLRDPSLRAALGRAGRERVRELFSFEGGVDRLLEKFSSVDEPSNSIRNSGERTQRREVAAKG